MKGRLFFSSRVGRSHIKNEKACKISKSHGSKAYLWDKEHQLECSRNSNSTDIKGYFNVTLCYQKLHYLRSKHRNVFCDWTASFPSHFGLKLLSLIPNDMVLPARGFSTLREDKTCTTTVWELGLWHQTAQVCFWLWHLLVLREREAT